MIKPEEKLKLMLELGLDSAASKWAEANNLTTMKFRAITEEKIEELLKTTYENKQPSEPEAPVAVAIIGGLVGVLLAAAMQRSLPTSIGIFVGSILVGLASGCFLGRAKTETENAIVCDMPLADWEDNLPYGALLSVKEAKQQGFKNFTIHFPATQESRYGRLQRIKADPIITATKSNGRKLYNIFAWDDGKIYE